MKINKLVQELNVLSKALNKKYSINSGGCCLYAHYIAAELEKYDIEYKAVLETTTQLDVNTAVQNLKFRKNLYEKKHSNVSIVGQNNCNHYSIIIGNDYINYSGDWNYTYIVNLNSSDLFWNYTNSCWNDTYNTDCSQIIKEKITQTFKKLNGERSIFGSRVKLYGL